MVKGKHEFFFKKKEERRFFCMVRRRIPLSHTRLSKAARPSAVHTHTRSHTASKKAASVDLRENVSFFPKISPSLSG